MCETVIVFFHATSMALFAHSFFPFYDRVAQGQLVSAHCVISFMCVVTKRRFADTILVVIHLADVLSASILKIKNHYSVVGSCLVSTVFSPRTDYTERTK